jgi:hypothetical protein
MRVGIRAAFFAMAISIGCAEATAPTFPSPPEGVIASITTTRQVQVSWQARPDNENIIAYGVYRDGLLIGETSSLTMVDTLAPQSKMHEYSVASRSSDGVVSEMSPGVSLFVPDATPPRVTSFTPADGALNVAPATAIQVVFGEAMDSASFSTSSFVVKDAQSNASLTGSLAYSKASRTITWSPTAPLPSERRIAVTVVGVKDTSGLALSQPFAFSFTTRETVPPTIVAFFPSNGATIPVGSLPSVQFSERMGDLFSGLRWIDAIGTVVAQGGVQDTLTNIVTLSPTKRIRAFVTYTILADDRAKDKAGNSLASNLSFSFQYAEWSLPSVVSVFPVENATGVPTSVTLAVNLDQPTQPYNDYEDRFNVRETGASTTLSGIEVNPFPRTQIRLSPSTLKPGTSYTAVFYHIFTDMSGVRHEFEKVWTFTTAGSANP